MHGELRRILYSSLEDVSVPYGPGVNERVFLKDMVARYGDDLHAVIPRPVHGMPEELSALEATLIPSWGSVRRVPGWVQARALGCLILINTIRRFRPDLLVMRAGAFSVPQYLAARWTPVPYVLKTGIGASFDVFYERYPLSRPLRRVNRAMADSLLLGTISIDVAGPAERNLLLDRHPSLASRVHVVDNGADLEHFHPGDEKGVRAKLGFSETDVVIGYVGAYPMRRGGKEVVDAVAAFRSAARAKGLVVGDTGEASLCLEYAKERGVSGDVVVYGAADYGDVPGLMRAMDVGLSVLRPRERGAIEQKVRQYLASGLCVVGTAGTNDFLRGKPFAQVVETEDLDEVLHAVAHFVVEGREGLSERGRQARAFAESALSFSARNTERIRIWEDALRQVE